MSMEGRPKRANRPKRHHPTNIKHCCPFGVHGCIRCLGVGGGTVRRVTAILGVFAILKVIGIYSTYNIYSTYPPFRLTIKP